MDSFNSPRCSIRMDYKWPYNWSEQLNTTSSNPGDPKAIQLDAISGMLLAFCIDILLLISFEYKSAAREKIKPLLHLLDGRRMFKNVLKTLLFIMLVLFLPLSVFCLLLAYVYKVICTVIIKKKDNYFVNVVDSLDVLWSLEDDTSKNIINVLGIIESHSPHAVAESIKNKLRDIIPNKNNEKIFYRRNEQYGFYYWTKYSSVDMDEYVEIVEIPDKPTSPNVTDLENLMTEIEKQALPYNNEGLFKILITKQSVGNHEEIKKEYGIIFRIHHSVGDGVALMEFLCDTFADKSNSCPVNMFSFPESNLKSPCNPIGLVKKLIEIPICLINEILRNADTNALHGPSLNGKKVFKWTESDENLMTMVKDIKANIQQLNFAAVLVTALSSGLKDILSKKMTHVPDKVAVVLPVRVPKSFTVDGTILKNDFSVTILDLPIGEENINEIQQRFNDLHKSAYSLTNYSVLKVVCSVLPNYMLRSPLKSRNATMVFSNMPGPPQLSICGGNTLKSLVFFIPHKGTTGIGVTSLSYGGVLRFAVMADSALVSEPEELSYILDGMVAEIKRLHQKYVMKT